MKATLHLCTLAVMMFFFSCGNEKKSDGSQKTDDANKDSSATKDAKPAADAGEKASCTYTYVHDSTTVHWTAFKFTSRAGVDGKFDSCAVTPAKAKGKVKAIMQGLTFTIPVKESNSNNEDRDMKILENFWGTMQKTQNITGTITSVEGDAQQGKAKVDLVMNGQTQQVEANYQVMDDGHFELTTNVNTSNFGGEPAIAALNEVCKKLHTGEDGKSKLWPDVDVKVAGYFAKDCK